jgi:hypothetical protein
MTGGIHVSEVIKAYNALNRLLRFVRVVIGGIGGLVFGTTLPLLLAGMIVQGVTVAVSGAGLLALLVFIIHRQRAVAEALYATKEEV